MPQSRAYAMKEILKTWDLTGALALLLLLLSAVWIVLSRWLR
jgi:hypothetical protein